MSLIWLSCALFGLGMYGILVRRDIVAVLACIEVMMGGALVLLVGLGSGARVAADATTDAISVEGIALMVVVVAAAEAAVGLALLVAIARRRGIARLDELTEVKG